MNREIKFRGRKLLSNEFVYGYLTSLNEIRVYVTDEWEGQYDTFLIDPNTIGQFTGRHDKNGAEIYEGDWCRAEFRTKDGIKVIQGNIIMDEFMWCIDCTGCVGDDIFSINRPHNFEVIGNIYENPELLKN